MRLGELGRSRVEVRLELLALALEVVGALARLLLVVLRSFFALGRVRHAALEIADAVGEVRLFAFEHELAVAQREQPLVLVRELVAQLEDLLVLLVQLLPEIQKLARRARALAGRALGLRLVELALQALNLCVAARPASERLFELVDARMRGFFAVLELANASSCGARLPRESAPPRRCRRLGELCEGPREEGRTDGGIVAGLASAETPMVASSSLIGPRCVGRLQAPPRFRPRRALRTLRR